jgi:hypothetical protein
MKRSPVISILVVAFVVMILLVAFYSSSQMQATAVAQGGQRGDPVLLQGSGRIMMLRVHELGTGYGPWDDFLDAEVVIRLDSQPDNALGFQLRSDDFRPAREGMLNLLRDAFNHDWIVTVDYWIEPGLQNGQLMRVWLTKP